jgi:nitroalkane oxidase
VDVNVPTTLLACGLGLQPVIQFGDAAQRKLFLQPFVDDSDGDLLAAFALTEVGGGANFDSADAEAGVQTLPRRDGDALVVTGEICSVLWQKEARHASDREWQELLHRGGLS